MRGMLTHPIPSTIKVVVPSSTTETGERTEPVLATVLL
jgi:hypothetical protein